MKTIMILVTVAFKWNSNMNQLFIVFFCKIFISIFSIFFFYQGFLSWTLTTHSTAGEGRAPSFIPLYHFRPLTNIQTFICNFVREMTITYHLYLPDCHSMRFTTFLNYHLTDDVMLIFVCLLDDLILDSVEAIWHCKLVDLNLHQLSPLYYKWTN